MSANIRVTHKSIGVRALQNLQTNLTNLGKLQEQLSSGKEVSKASDNPSATSQAMRFSTQLRSLEQYSRNATDGENWLATIDKALSGASEVVTRAREITLTGMSDGAAATSGAREALAMEIKGLRAQLMQLANTQYLNRPVFGGTTTNSNAFNATTGAYVGDSNPIVRTVGDGVDIPVNAIGTDAFGAGPTNVFTILDNIANDMAANPSALGAHLGLLENAATTITGAVADVGARSNRMERMHQIVDDRKLTLSASLSNVRDIDLPGTIVKLQMQETAYQAALGATQRIIQPSLVDFLR